MKKAYVIIKERNGYEIIKPLKDANSWELNNLPRLIVNTRTREQKRIEVEQLRQLDVEAILEGERSDYTKLCLIDSFSDSLIWR